MCSWPKKVLESKSLALKVQAYLPQAGFKLMIEANETIKLRVLKFINSNS